jgi:flagellar biosynthetic protein FliQ
MGDAVVNALREALYLALLCAAPPLAAAAATGLVMSLAQASMRVEERTLQVVPRLVAALLALAVAGPWIGAELTRFTAAVLAALPAFARP